MSSSQISSGLSAAFGAAALLGKNGAIALLITLFMAVTSSSSSELIATSSILTFDIYKCYIKPHASPKELIFVSHVMICVFGLVMATFACIWNAVGIDLGWLFLTMGLIIGGAVFPAAFTLCWKGQTRIGAISGCLGGLVAGLTAWLVEAQVHYGELTVASTGGQYPTLAGNMAAVLTGLILSFAVSIIKPDNFDWAITRSINVKADEGVPVYPGAPPSQLTSGEETPTDASEKEKVDTTTPGTPVAMTPTHTSLPGETDAEMLEDEAIIRDPARLNRMFKVALILSTVLSFIMDFLLPMPMFFTHYVFSEGFFKGWVIISFLWVFFALGTCGVLPIVETWGFWKGVLGRMKGEERRRSTV